MQPTTLIDILERHAAQQPDKPAYMYLADGKKEDSALTYCQLSTKAKAVAVHLLTVCEPGDRAILLYHSGLEFLTSFFGCLYAGVIAVPAYPPKKNSSVARVEVISADAQAAVALTTSQISKDLERQFELSATLRGIPLVATDQIAAEKAGYWSAPPLKADSLAFLQYTSGSTGNPKGVMVGHDNLLNNLLSIDDRIEHTSESCMVTWLPVFHDLGLIYTILMPLYKGYPCYVMAPAAFVKKPLHWIQALSTYRATHSAAPNFAYDLCLTKAQEQPQELEGLDLTHLRVMINGAEPVRSGTIRKFLAVYEPYGFRPQAVCPAYGLAEGTLAVSIKYSQHGMRELVVDGAALERHEVVPGSTGRKTTTLISCGKLLIGVHAVIVNPDTHLPCLPHQVGEIWVSGGAVTKGYWQNTAATTDVFDAYLHDTTDGPYLRTGDLGFLFDGELFITGRLKDLLVIRGVNHYPQDIELTAENSHEALRKGHCVAFSVELADEERLVIACELNRHFLQNIPENDIYDRVREAIGLHHALDIYAIVLLKTMSIPKTSSGKIQRQDCRRRFLRGNLTVVAGSGPSPQVLFNLSYLGRLREQMRCGPSAPALQYGNNHLSLAQLDAQANTLARTLASLPLANGEQLALHLVPTPELLVTLLALMKTGLPFIALDWNEVAITYPDCGNNLTLLIPYKGSQLSLPRGTQRTTYFDVDLTAPSDVATETNSWPDDRECVVVVTSAEARHTYTADAIRTYCNHRTGRAGDSFTLTVPSNGLTFGAALDLLWALSAGKLLVFAEQQTSVEMARSEEVKSLDFSLLYFSSNEAAFASDKYRIVVEGGKFADTHDFKAVWLPERHFHPFGGLYPDPCVLAAALATVTSRVRLRAGSVVLPMHDPIRVAESWSVVDNLSQGRVDLSFARGWNPTDFVLAPDTFVQRRDVLFSRLDMVKQLWRGEAVRRPNGQGNEVAVSIFPLPQQPELPVWITCSGGEEMFVKAGEVGANVLTALLFQSPDELAQKIAAYRQARERSGHGAATGTVTLMLHTFIHPDPAYVRQQVTEPFMQYLRSSVDLWQHEFGGIDKFSAPEREQLITYAFERYMTTTALFGTPDSCHQLVDQLRAAGVDEIAALIDFGIDAQTVLDNLVHLDTLRQWYQPLAGRRDTEAAPARAANAGGEDLAVAEWDAWMASYPKKRPPTSPPAPLHTPAKLPVPLVPPAVPDAQIRREVHKKVITCVARSLSLLPEQIPATKSFYSIGVDSLRAVEIISMLNQSVNVELSPSVLFEAPTVDRLTDYLLTYHLPELTEKMTNQPL